MTDREYPRWVHAEGRKSIVVETPEDEAAFLAVVMQSDVSAANHVAFVAPQRYDIYPLADGSGVHEAPADAGGWVRWNDVAPIFGANLLTTPAQPSAAPVEPLSDVPKRTGGWPKGKPRAPKQAAVN